MENGASQQEPKAAADLGLEETVLDQVRRALNEIEFGSILIKIHQGKVVGFETSIKFRLGN